MICEKMEALVVEFAIFIKQKQNALFLRTTREMQVGNFEKRMKDGLEKLWNNLQWNFNIVRLILSAYKTKIL